MDHSFNHKEQAPMRKSEEQRGPRQRSKIELYWYGLYSKIRSLILTLQYLDETLEQIASHQENLVIIYLKFIY